MGTIVRSIGDGVTKHYWYPGHKSDWIRTAVAVGAGAMSFLVIYVLTKNNLPAAVVGTSVTTGVGGFHLGRRDVVALREFHDMTGRRRAAIRDSGRAAWRGTVRGIGCALAAVMVMNVSAAGFVADWLLPMVPVVVGALAHATGMVVERLGEFGKKTVSSPLAGRTEEGTATTKRLEPAGGHSLPPQVPRRTGTPPDPTGPVRRRRK